MKYKGFVLSVLLFFVFLGLYFLPFTWMDIQVQRRANKKATNEHGIVDLKKKQEYLNSIWDKEAYKIFRFKFTYEEIKRRSLAFGLDLQGGMSVVVDVDIDEALVQLAAKNYKTKLKSILSGISDKDKNDIKLLIELVETKIRDKDPQATIVDYFEDVKNNIEEGRSTTEEVKVYLIDKLTGILKRTFDVVKARIDRNGTLQANIQRLKNSRKIQIEIPGVNDPERVKSMLKGVARLQFWLDYEQSKKKEIIKLINDKLNITLDGKPIKLEEGKFYTEREARAIKNSLRSDNAISYLPENLHVFYAREDEGAKKGVKIYFFSCDEDGEAALYGDVITDARPSRDQFGNVIVQIQMNKQGAKVWKSITEKNRGKSVAATLDDKIVIHATISDVIPDGRTSISGNYTPESARDLSLMLKSGSLPVPVNIVEETIIGPALSSIAKGKGFKAVFIALLVILLLMLLLYSRCGIIVNLALFLNFIFILTGFVAINSVLTLTGLVGLVLTLSMAIDANVLINERIKEEISIGRGVREAVKNGYALASSSIFDSNMTTLLTAMVLFFFGSGSIRGFATTLIIGILSSFFTAVYVSRYFLYLKEKNKTLRNMSFSWPFTRNIFRNSNFDFVTFRYVAYVFSFLILIFGSIALYKKGFQYGLDFSGGYSYVVKANIDIDSAEIKDKLHEKVGQNIDVKTYGSNDTFKISIGSMEKNVEKDVYANIVKDVVRQIVESKKERTTEQIGGNGSLDGTNSVDNVEGGQMLDEEKKNTMEGSSTPFSPKQSVIISDNKSDEKSKEDNKGTKMLDSSFDLNKKAPQQVGKSVEIISTERIESDMVDEIKNNARYSILFVLLIIFLYILLRFKRWQYALAAIISLFHDIVGVVALCGIFNFLGYTVEFDFIFITAILTILGYSINNTVIIFDRIRENVRSLKEAKNQDFPPIAELINNSINKTLSRTIITSITTIIAVVIIFLYGGFAIEKFAFILLLGFSFGMYSSIFISAPILKDLKAKIE